MHAANPAINPAFKLALEVSLRNNYPSGNEKLHRGNVNTRGKVGRMKLF